MRILTKDELSALLARNKLQVQSSRIKGDNIIRTFSLSIKTERKLDRLCRKFDLDRSKVVRLLIESIEV